MIYSPLVQLQFFFSFFLRRRLSSRDVANRSSLRTLGFQPKFPQTCEPSCKPKSPLFNFHSTSPSSFADDFPQETLSTGVLFALSASDRNSHKLVSLLASQKPSKKFKIGDSMLGFRPEDIAVVIGVPCVGGIVSFRHERDSSDFECAYLNKMHNRHRDAIKDNLFKLVRGKSGTEETFAKLLIMFFLSNIFFPNTSQNDRKEAKKKNNDEEKKKKKKEEEEENRGISAIIEKNKQRMSLQGFKRKLWKKEGLYGKCKF